MSLSRRGFIGRLAAALAAIPSIPKGAEAGDKTHFTNNESYTSRGQHYSRIITAQDCQIGDVMVDCDHNWIGVITEKAKSGELVWVQTHWPVDGVRVCVRPPPPPTRELMKRM